MDLGRHGEANLKDVIVPRVQDLSPALQVAADYVLKNPNVVAMRTLRHAAELSHVNPPTFTRLAQALGLKNYEELRELCRQELEHGPTTFAEKTAALQKREGNGEGSFFSSHATASAANIETLIDTTELAALAGIASQLAKARNVLLVGALSSAALVEYFGYLARMAFPNWRTVPRDHETSATALYGLGSQDALLVLSIKPYASRAITVAKHARGADVPVFAVTDSYSAPIVSHATHTFVVPTDSPHFFASAVPVVVLFEALLAMVVRRSGKETHQRIAAIEHENHRTGEYWQS